MAVALGIAAGLVLGVAALQLVPGVAGVVVAVAVAALGYVGVSNLATRERRLGGVAASLLPDGELVSATIDQASDLVRDLRRDAKRTHDAQVGSAIASLCDALERLARYVEENPSSNGQLAHVVNTYGEQVRGLVDAWVGLELSGSKRRIGNSRDDLLVALQGATAAADAALGNATDARAAQIEAASAAIKRLAAMEGLGPDAAPKVGESDLPKGSEPFGR